MRITLDRTPNKLLNHSELQTWSTCRQKWYWAYGLNLEPNQTPFKMLRGTIGHAASTVLWKGGKVTWEVMEWSWYVPSSKVVIQEWPPLETLRWDYEAQAALEEYIADHPMFDEDKEVLYDMLAEVLDIALDHYEYWTIENADQPWQEVLFIEERLTAIMPGIDVPVVGTIDILARDASGFWIVDEKWPNGQLQPDEAFDLDEQAAMYDSLAEATGIKIVGVVYDQVGKIPKRPTLNKDGSMSKVAKGDWRTYKKELELCGLDPARYSDMHGKLPYCSSYRRTKVFRGEHEKVVFTDGLAAKAEEVLSPTKSVYMCDDRLRCRSCQFRELCIEQLKGGDVDFLVKNAFRQREDRYAPSIHMEDETS